MATNADVTWQVVAPTWTTAVNYSLVATPIELPCYRLADLVSEKRYGDWADEWAIEHERTLRRRRYLLRSDANATLG